ncbi:hypothetical protein [Algoriphagus hitonicola]|uniref:Uncharacterized protein n=1 Tax=Algoriphagus hitonicola TaxID=435880 RepID=A0A1I2XFP4_9BACT|nr:hypothetical protein [Algoriphagus hitonicola]SFH12320.1 hypothetical protein SAMN04487988_11862 [Algoriphagus hitonicola]
MKKTLLFIIFLGVNLSLYAQSEDFLLLKRGPSPKKHIRFYPGESITYKSKKLDYFVTDQIREFSQDYIFLTENILSLDDIEAIDIRQKDSRNSTLKNMNVLILGSGIILLTAESINSIYQNREFSIDQGVGLTSGILIGTGLALLPLRYKVFKIQGRNRLQILLKNDVELSNDPKNGIN